MSELKNELEFDEIRPWEVETTFNDVLARQLAHAPYIIASIVLHFLIGLIVAGIMILTASNEEPPPQLVAAPPPPPPPDVPDLEDSDTNSPSSVRERLEAHRVNPVCASCHSRMDPFGLLRTIRCNRWFAQS